MAASANKQRKRKNSGDKQKTASPSRATSSPSSTSSAKRRRIAVPVKEIEGVLEATPGRALAFGTGDTGQLGLGPDLLERKKPALVKGDLDGIKVVQICSGGMHTIALTKDGRVFSWGCNDEGSLGRLTDDDDECTEPAEVKFPEETGKVVAISAGDSHSAAITANGSLYFWGGWRDNSGSMTDKLSTPVHVPTPVRLSKIASGYHHLVALGVDGAVFTMGCGENGQLGRLAERFSTRNGRHWQRELMTPALVPLKQAARDAEKRNHQGATGDLNRSQEGGRSSVAVDVWAGGYGTIVKLESGHLFGFGLNSGCQLGFESVGSGEEACVFKPTFLPSLTSLDPNQIALGHHHTLIIAANGAVHACGGRIYGACGDDDEDNDAPSQKTPKKVEGLETGVAAVAAGIYTSYAVTSTGELWSWGTGTNNSLGHGDEEDHWVAKRVEAKQLETRRVVGVSAGGQHCAIFAEEAEGEAKNGA